MAQSFQFPDVRVWIDGVQTGKEAARVSVFDRGFLYGDSVFETLRTYRGRPFALAEHMARLEESARRVWITLPVSAQDLASEVRKAASESPFEESYLRLMITRGVGALGLDPGTAVAPLRVLLVGRLTPPAPELYETGIAVISFETARAGDATQAAGAKIGNYLVAVLAHREAARHDAHEALIMDRAGRIIEGATSNIFWIMDGVLLTPPLDAGILAGVTRAHILLVAEELGLPVRQTVPEHADLLSADEVFISSSIRELLPVVKLDGKQIGSGRPGVLSRRLLAAFREHCLAAAQ